MSIRPFGACLLVCVLIGCGGTGLVKHPQPPPSLLQPLAQAADAQLAASLDWVIVRGSPGTWAKNADWDEYQLRLRGTGSAPLQVTDVVVFDSHGVALAPQTDRKSLVAASRKVVQRYKEVGLESRSGMSGKALATTGLGTGLGVGGAIAAGGGYAAIAGAAVFVAIAPVFLIVGSVRGVRNHQVNQEIARRRTQLPLPLAASQEQPLDLFFPLAPSPQKVQITYTDAQGEHVLMIDTQAALAGLHLEAPPPGAQVISAAP